MAEETKGPGKGWSERELLSSLLYLVQKNAISFNWNDGVYPANRNANGFRQKITVLKNQLKPEWEAMGGSLAAPEGTAKGTPKKPSTPRKRKGKDDDEVAGEAEASPKKPRGRPKKKPVEPEAEIEEEIKVKDEVKDEVNGDDDLEAEI